MLEAAELLRESQLALPECPHCGDAGRTATFTLDTEALTLTFTATIFNIDVALSREEASEQVRRGQPIALSAEGWEPVRPPGSHSLRRGHPTAAGT